MQGRRLNEEEKPKLRIPRLALAAFICSVLPFAPFLCLPLALVPGIGIGLYIVILSLMFYPFHVLLLGILGTSLAIISIKREQRGRTLASAAIFLGLLEIGVGSYTLMLLITTDGWWSNWELFG